MRSAVWQTCSYQGVKWRLMGVQVDLLPALQRDDTQRRELVVLDVGWQVVDRLLLEVRNPGNCRHQQLLRLIVLLRTAGGVEVLVSLRHQRVGCWHIDAAGVVDGGR